MVRAVHQDRNRPAPRHQRVQASVSPDSPAQSTLALVAPRVRELKTNSPPFTPPALRSCKPSLLPSDLTCPVGSRLAQSPARPKTLSSALLRAELPCNLASEYRMAAGSQPVPRPSHTTIGLCPIPQSLAFRMSGKEFRIPRRSSPPRDPSQRPSRASARRRRHWAAGSGELPLPPL